MRKTSEIVPPGQHPYDPKKADIDPVAFSLSRIQTLLAWADEHRASFEKARNSDPETAESELSNLRISIRDAMIYLQRLSELVLSGYTVDPQKRLPESIDQDWFSSCLRRKLAAEGICEEINREEKTDRP